MAREEFSVVMTLKAKESKLSRCNRDVYVSVVPTQWIEKRSHTLYFPDRTEHAKAWPRLGNAAPEPDETPKWRKYAVVVLAKFSDYDSAVRYALLQIRKVKQMLTNLRNC